MDQEIIYIEDSESFIIGTNILREGNLTTAEFEKALDLAIKGCNQISEVQKEALKKRYGE